MDVISNICVTSACKRWQFDIARAWAWRRADFGRRASGMLIELKLGVWSVVDKEDGMFLGGGCQ